MHHPQVVESQLFQALLSSLACIRVSREMSTSLDFLKSKKNDYKQNGDIDKE